MSTFIHAITHVSCIITAQNAQLVVTPISLNVWSVGLAHILCWQAHLVNHVTLEVSLPLVLALAVYVQ